MLYLIKAGSKSSSEERIMTQVNRRDIIKAGFAGISATAFASSAFAQTQSTPRDTVIYLYDGMTALDAIGPYEVLRFLPNANVRFVAKTKGPIRTDSRMLSLVADATIDEIKTAHMLLIPGGATTLAQMQDAAIIDWIRRLHPTTTWTTAVCTGTGVLAAAGLLKGLKATTHWASLEALKAFGVNAVAERVVREGKIMTAAGVSAGLDMALTLAALETDAEFAKAIQLGIEYDPKPPFDSGSVSKSTPETIQRAAGLLAKNTRRARQ
jgi:putative intracellular protease/amidase